MTTKNKIIDISGLLIQDILKMQISEFRGVSTANLKQVTSRLVSAMNKRIKRLGKSEIGRLSPTYKAFEKHGKYSVKGLSRKSTIQEFKNLQESLKKKTSLSEFKKYRKELYKKLGVDFGNNIKLERKFWKVYHKFEESNKAFMNVKKGVSSDVLNFLSNNVDWKHKSQKEINQILNDKYKELKSTHKPYKSESDYFEDEGN